jgi:hypothetical protein
MIINPPHIDGEIPVYCLWQPWADHVGLDKFCETRGWGTDYRGPVAIYAAKRWDAEVKAYCAMPKHREVLSTRHGLPASLTEAEYLRRLRQVLPLGAIVATANVVDCVRSEQFLRDPEFAERRSRPHELAFGDYGPGRWIHLLEGVQRLETAVPWTGRQGWFTVPTAAVRQTLE